MKIALYRAKYGNWIDGGINVLSGNDGFSHVELVFPSGVSYSSTTKDKSFYGSGKPKKDGTRFKRINFDPERWLFIPIQPTPVQVSEMLRRAWGEIDCRYDYAGCFRCAELGGIHLLPFLKQHKDKWFCSEITAHLLQSVGLFPISAAPHTISPNRIAELYHV